MPLQAGERLGAFEILTLIGSGGMGEVYRARDTKLNRDVAIKTLPAGVATDPERLARFQLEAQVLASLNHPNIAHIYGVEDSQDVHALVMELVDGPTLAERIAQGPIPLDDTLSIAAQIARAIEAAHAQDVIHRDLKPANIKVRSDGTVKVLDFGLAKALAPGLPTAPSGLSQLPTVASPAVTQAGMVLGTAAYMSPEQARGRAAGKPADVWAFGCVLFEMLTGRSAFAGETMSDTIAKTLGQEPDWKALPASTPGRVREVLRRCLQKERAAPLSRHQGRESRARAGGNDAEWMATHGRGLDCGGRPDARDRRSGARWLLQKPASPPNAHAPMTILIADFENRTNDPTFDRALEPVLRISLENATFISAYDRTRIDGTLGVRPPDKLDERAALELAVKQGVNTVLSGSIEKQGDGYILSATATQTVTGNRSRAQPAGRRTRTRSSRRRRRSCHDDSERRWATTPLTRLACSRRDGCRRRRLKSCGSTPSRRRPAATASSRRPCDLRPRPLKSIRSSASDISSSRSPPRTWTGTTMRCGTSTKQSVILRG